ncbi:hypothetical protein [Candidatus Finniella inopinata]|uniref:Uncharacterized protein n=1 Tax=Candidatus Finniella inopinata TaxID=1696036 RepID=A0A4Q7DPX9_9PROT|nr:hypothetical protein [Candidatus Finniella inopinata]RZI47086.1 hypothetical protein EQU50_00425 [Candidatus Finniella inopinata]
MKFKTLKWIGLALVMTLTIGHAADSEYWREFEAKGIPLMDHIRNLSNVPQTASDIVKDHTKNALAYFFATGGKYGFREAPATASEYEILVKALAVTTTLHYSTSGKVDVLDLVAVRRSYNLTNEDERIRDHLIKAQAIISYTVAATDLFQSVSAPTNLKSDDELGNRGIFIRQVCFDWPLKGLVPAIAENNLKKSYISGLTEDILKTILSTPEPTYIKKIHTLLTKEPAKQSTMKMDSFLLLNNEKTYVQLAVELLLSIVKNWKSRSNNFSATSSHTINGVTTTKKWTSLEEFLKER